MSETRSDDDTLADRDADGLAPIRREPEATFDGCLGGDPEGLAVPASAFVFAEIGRAQFAVGVFAAKEVAKAVVVGTSIMPVARVDTADHLDVCPHVGLFEDLALERFFVMFAELNAATGQ